ncbi:MAG TPA: OmpH family outer membrane protein [Gammaproteobacteria bacterium]|nr:OmpH family outer membrane protein [Gammaproteobacteria bacterium]
MRQGFIAAMLGVAALFVFSPAYAAKSAASSDGPKIGVVDLQAVIGNSHRGQQANQALQQKVSELQAQAKDLGDKTKALKDQLDKTDAKASNYDALKKQYDDSGAEFQDFVNESRQLIEQRRQELLQPIQQELIKVLGQFAKDNRYDILLNKDSGAIYSSDAYDATTAVTEAMDKDWAALEKANPAPTPAPAASTKGPSR